ncbi:ASCH domain-containing protein [uncultured Bacteroides sp.]|uniref:ASCH domain-containing protein n=1 Tax=uncultured Bacteroides sp. TaxID=162156 RepID=UPI002595D612|nr:ASCH domain-containing protein [uncultured Bacteroides sp.]
MKAISIKQPWASLIAHGIKDIENRTWKCPQKYIGQRILIHASKVRTKDYFIPKSLFINSKVCSILESKELPEGAIIGSVVIADCVQNHLSVWAKKGVWNWVLKDAVLFDKPIREVKGRLGFWDCNLDIPINKSDD